LLLPSAGVPANNVRPSGSFTSVELIVRELSRDG
jgi:hypothetical protein